MKSRDRQLLFPPPFQVVMRDRARAQDAELVAKEKRDAVCIEYAQRAIALHTFIESVQSALSAPLVDTETLSDAQQLKEQFDSVIVAGYEQQKSAFEDVRAANEKVIAEGVTNNPFCHITMEVRPLVTRREKEAGVICGKSFGDVLRSLLRVLAPPQLHYPRGLVVDG